MGIFFQERVEKSTKSMIVIRAVIAILMAILLITGIVTGFEFFYFKLIFIMAGIGSILDGIEKYIQSKKSKGFLLEFAFAILWLILAFSW